MNSPYRQIVRAAFEHAFFDDGKLRCLHIVPTPACVDILRRAGLLLRHLDDGIAVFGDDAATERLRLYLAEAGAPLAMPFQVFVTDPHFFEYTTPAWPTGQLLFLDTARAAGIEVGRQLLHAAPTVTADAFVERDDPRMQALLGRRVLSPRPAMVLRIALSTSLLDQSDAARRVFNVRFEAAATRWKYCVFGLQDSQPVVIDLAGEIEFDHERGVDIADGRRADVFLSRCAIPMRDAPQERFQLRASGAAGDRVIIKRMPNASVGKRFRESRDGHKILVSEVFINL